MENRCSKICSQNPWKIPMKSSFLVKLQADSLHFFSRVPWGFYHKKKCVKIVFFAGFILRQKRRGRRLCDFIKNELLQRYFSRILIENFPWQLSEQLFIRRSFFQNISVAASELCLAPLDYSLYHVFNFPRLLFCLVYPRHRVQLHNGWFERRKEVLGICDKDWHLARR